MTRREFLRAISRNTATAALAAEMATMSRHPEEQRCVISWSDESGGLHQQSFHIAQNDMEKGYVVLEFGTSIVDNHLTGVLT